MWHMIINCATGIALFQHGVKNRLCGKLTTEMPRDSSLGKVDMRRLCTGYAPPQLRVCNGAVQLRAAAACAEQIGSGGLGTVM